MVEGLQDLLPEDLRDIEERSFALKDFQLTSDGADRQDNIDSNAPTTRTVNGEVNPSLSIAPGETQLWRLANIGADIWYQVGLEDTRSTSSPRTPTRSGDVDRRELVLPPGKRFDVLVQGRSAGHVHLQDPGLRPGR